MSEPTPEEWCAVAEDVLRERFSPVRNFVYEWVVKPGNDFDSDGPFVVTTYGHKRRIFVTYFVKCIDAINERGAMAALDQLKNQLPRCVCDQIQEQHPVKLLEEMTRGERYEAQIKGRCVWFRPATRCAVCSHPAAHHFGSVTGFGECNAAVPRRSSPALLGMAAAEELASRTIESIKCSCSNYEFRCTAVVFARPNQTCHVPCGAAAEFQSERDPFSYACGRHAVEAHVHRQVAYRRLKYTSPSYRPDLHGL